MVLTNGYMTGDVVDYGWLIAFVLLGAAALEPSMRTLAEPAPEQPHQMTGQRIVLLAAASLLAPAVLIIQYLRSAPIDVPVIAGGTMLLFALSLVHMHGLLRQLRQALDAQQQVEQQLTFQALHDPLTGLPNRTLFTTRLSDALTAAARHQRTLAVLFVDLDGFNAVNDGLGHESGDALLRTVAERLQACVRTGDTVARLGGDEFTLVLADIPDIQTAVWVAERIIEDLQVSINIASRQLTINASIGIAWSTTGGEQPEELMRAADVAMYRAKQNGKNQLCLFDAAVDSSMLMRLELEADLRRGIELKEFVLVYQPIVEFATGWTFGMEALLRWQHPQRGLLMPADFITLAEETGLIVPLGRWVLHEACRQVQIWDGEHPAHNMLTMSVNLSARQLAEPTLVADVAAILKKTGLPAERIALELTERMMLNTMQAVAVCEQLKTLGIQSWVDDFGAGSSILNTLTRFLVDVLKIDRAFLADRGQDQQSTALIKAVVTLGQSMGLAVIAEGMETAEQVVALRRATCTIGQGFYYAVPLEPAAVSTWLHNEIQRGRNVVPLQPVMPYTAGTYGGSC